MNMKNQIRVINVSWHVLQNFNRNNLYKDLKFKSNQHTSKEAIKTLKTLLRSGMYKLMSTFGTNKEANTAGTKFELY